MKDLVVLFCLFFFLLDEWNMELLFDFKERQHFRGGFAVSCGFLGQQLKSYRNLLLLFC